jgi:hypothetical protein
LNDLEPRSDLECGQGHTDMSRWTPGQNVKVPKDIVDIGAVAVPIAPFPSPLIEPDVLPRAAREGGWERRQVSTAAARQAPS